MNSSAAFRSEGADGPRVLIVDDDHLGTEVRAELIRMSGFSVDVASSGTEALAKACSCDFDIFVIDYDMSGMNGVKLARELRRQGHGAPIAMVPGRLEPPSEPGAELLTCFVSKGQGSDILLQALLDLSPRPPTKAITTHRKQGMKFINVQASSSYSVFFGYPADIGLCYWHLGRLGRWFIG